MTSKQIDPTVDFEDTPFHMGRADFAGVPQCALPEGYAFRTYRPGDDAVWTAIQRAAEPFIDITDDLFEKQYGGNRAALSDRMFFVETAEGQTVASISAWWERDWTIPDDRGRIHWVVVHPDHQGRGLAKAMMTKAMGRLAQSHRATMLGTSSGRPWAVKVYLDFGFLPELHEMTNPAIVAAWYDVQRILHHPALQSWLETHGPHHHD